MRTTKFFYEAYKYAVLLILATIFYACDPALDETMVVVNQTDDSITIVLEKMGYFKDTSEFYFLYDFYYPRRFVGDSLLIVECVIAPGSELLLIDHGPLGTISFDTKDDGMFYLQEIIDTLYLNDKLLIKDVFDKDNWDLFKDEYRNGGGVSKFSFSINPLDLR